MRVQRVQRVQKVQRVQRVQRVKVDGASPRGLWPPDAANYKKGARLAPQVVSKGCVRFRSGSDSACGAEGCGIALSGDEYKVSVTGFTFCVI